LSISEVILNLFFSDLLSKCAGADCALILFVLLCAVTDVWKKKIYNWATFPAVILGAGLNFIYSGWSGAGNSLLGVLAGFLLLYFFYLGGGIGAGDVKLLMGVGALKGPLFVFKASVCGIFVAGVITVFLLLVNGTLLKGLKNVGIPLFTSAVSGFKISPLPQTKSPSLPFGFYLAIGILIYFFYEKFTAVL